MRPSCFWKPCGLGLDGIIVLVRVELVVGIRATVHGDMGDQRVVAGAVDIELGARIGVLAVAVRHLGIGGNLTEGHVDLVESPVDLEEAGTCLREGGRDSDAHDGLVAVYGGDTDSLAVIVIGVLRLVVAILELAGWVDADMAASQVEVCGVGDLHAGGRGLRVDRAGALDGSCRTAGRRRPRPGCRAPGRWSSPRSVRRTGSRLPAWYDRRSAVPVYLLWPAVWKVMPTYGAVLNFQVPMLFTLPANALVAIEVRKLPTVLPVSFVS